MNWQASPLFFVLAFASGVAAAVGLFALRRRGTPGARSFALMMLEVAVWAYFSALQRALAGPSFELLFAKVSYVGIVSVPPLWLMFALGYTNQSRWLTSRNLALLWSIPVITMVMVATNGWHHWMWKSLEPASRTGQLVFSYGPYFWIHTIFSYLILLAGTVVLVRAVLGSTELYKDQAGVLLTGAFLPWISIIPYGLGVSWLQGLDPTPLAFVLTGIVYAWGIFRLQLYTAIPVGWDEVIERLMDGVMVLDPRNCIIAINSQARKMLCLNSETTIGQNIRDLMKTWPDKIEQNEILEVEMDTSPSNGESLYLDVRIAPLRGQRGRLMGRLAVLRDITENRKTEEKLRLQSVALESAGTAMMITRRDGTITWVNSSFTDITGYELAEVLGKKPSMLSSGAQESGFFEALWETILSGKTWHGELVNQRKDGTFYTEEQIIAPVRDDHGEITHFIAIKQDITDRKVLEKMRDDLVHTVVHDLRNPLSSISASLEVFRLLANKAGLNFNDEQNEVLDMARNNVQRMANLVNAILDISRLENEKMPLHSTQVSIYKLVSDAMQFQTQLAGMKGLQLLNMVPEDLPLVSVDIGLIGRVLQNLIDNAIKFTPEGGMIFVTAAEDQEEHRMVVSVNDSGPGVPVDLQPRLFQKFASGSQAGYGTGLGLAFCRLAIEAHGGRIWVESEEGKGATFAFSLPSNTEEIVEGEEQLSAQSQTRA